MNSIGRRSLHTLLQHFLHATIPHSLSLLTTRFSSLKRHLQAMLDQRDFTGKAALHHAVTDIEERHKVLRSLLAAKAQVLLSTFSCGC